MTSVLTREDPRFPYAYGLHLGVAFIVLDLLILLLTGLGLGTVRLFHPLPLTVWPMVRFLGVALGGHAGLSTLMIVLSDRALRRGPLSDRAGLLDH